MTGRRARRAVVYPSFSDSLSDHHLDIPGSLLQRGGGSAPDVKGSPGFGGIGERKGASQSNHHAELVVSYCSKRRRCSLLSTSGRHCRDVAP